MATSFFLFLHFGGWKLQWTGKELGLSLVEKLSVRWKDAPNYQCRGCLTIPYYKKCKSTSGKHNRKHPSTIFQFVGCVHGPAVKLPLSSLLTYTMVSHTPTFSTPSSTRTLEGQNSPSLLTASRNNSRTVLLYCWHYISKTLFSEKICLYSRELVFSIGSESDVHPDAKANLPTPSQDSILGI